MQIKYCADIFCMQITQQINTFLMCSLYKKRQKHIRAKENLCSLCACVFKFCALCAYVLKCAYV